MGEAVIRDNLTCVRRGYAEVREIPRQLIMRDVERESLALAGKKVRDVMTSSVVSCRPDTLLRDVIRTMADRDISAIVVVDETGALQGVLSSTDLRRAALTQADLEGQLPQFQPSHLMSREVFTTWPDEPLEAAAKRLFDHQVHRLVVTASEEDRTPVGILSMSDLVQLLPPAQAA